MSITDELREWVTDHYSGWKSKQAEGIAIADRIDAEHEKAVRERRRSCIYYDPERHYCSCHDFDVSGYVELPKDADGEYIHVGDEMCGYGWPNGGVYCRAIVNEVTILVGPQDGAYRGWLMWVANECRHHHTPTVEDVLTEFGIDWEHESDCEDRAALLKEYASKLRLAEGEDA